VLNQGEITLSMDSENGSTVEHIPSKGELQIVMAMVAKWGWDLAIENIADDEPIGGMIIGCPDFIDEVIGEENPYWITYIGDTTSKTPTQQ